MTFKRPRNSPTQPGGAARCAGAALSGRPARRRFIIGVSLSKTPIKKVWQQNHRALASSRILSKIKKFFTYPGAR